MSNYPTLDGSCFRERSMLWENDANQGALTAVGMSFTPA